MVAFPFILMILGIVETSLMFTSAVMVEGGTGVASRLIRTCQLQNMTGDPRENFVRAFCDHAVVLPNCNADLKVEAIAMPDNSFINVAGYPPVFDENGIFTPSGFSTGGVNDVMLVRAVYSYRLITPWFASLMGGDDGRTTFMSTTVFQVEPCEVDQQ